MKFILKNLFLLCCCLSVSVAISQKTEASIETKKPIDGVYERTMTKDKLVLKYDNLREADVFWEKRIWRVIDVREKRNKHFTYPNAPFVNILLDAAKEGKLTLYDAQTDDFSIAFSKEESAAIGVSYDTIMYHTLESCGDEELKVIRNELNWEDIKRFRLKEVWYFDEENSVMKSRILGIAPLLEIYDDNGNFKYEVPLFWAYYPDTRNVLAKKEVVNPFNDASPMSWEDIFEARYFASYIYKGSNIYDRRIMDYKSGVDKLLEGDKINKGIFNFEEDVWSK